jgi:hypothetical protein
MYTHIYIYVYVYVYIYIHILQAVLSAAGIGDTSNSSDDTDDHSSSNSKCDSIRGIGGIAGNVSMGGNGPPKLQLQTLEHLKIPTKLATDTQQATATATVTTPSDDTPPLKLYLEKFDIAPIRLHLSFTLAAAHHATDSSGSHSIHSGITDDTSSDTVSTGLTSSSTSSTATSTAANPLFLLLKAMGATLANIENAPLHMRAVSIRDKLASPQQLVALLIGHYTRQALGQAYKIVGSAELLGNPIGLLQSLGAGVSCSVVLLYMLINYACRLVHCVVLSSVLFGECSALLRLHNALCLHNTCLDT